jgi:HSP20 family molecular chaperone IbpA
MFEQAFTPFFTNQQQSNGGSTPGFQSLPVNVWDQSLPVNVWETNEAYHAALMAPGVDEQNINVTVHDDMLAIEGELKFQTPDGAQSIWQEFGPARFRRSLRLGSSVDPGKVEATYRNGILFVTMPKAEHARPRQVQVQLGDANAARKLTAGG